jgi:hypothetical protein
VTAIGLYLAAALLLAVAGITKAARPSDTALALQRLAPGLARAASPTVRILAATEAGVGVLALVWVAPVPAALVAASYGSFAVVVLAVRSRGGPLATCGCFGGIDTPPTVTHAVIDVVAACSAVAVAVHAPSHPLTTVLGPEPLHGVPLVFGSAVTALLAFAAMSLLGRVQAASRQMRQGTVTAGPGALP